MQTKSAKNIAKILYDVFHHNPKLQLLLVLKQQNNKKLEFT